MKMTQRQMKMVTVRLPAEDRDALKAFADERELSIQQLLEQYIYTLIPRTDDKEQ